MMMHSSLTDFLLQAKGGGGGVCAQLQLANTENKYTSLVSPVTGYLTIVGSV